MKAFVNKVLSTGIMPGQDEIQRRKVRFLNGVIAVSLLALVFLATMEALEGCYWAMPMHVARVAGFLLALSVLSRGRYVTAIYILQYTVLLSSIAGTAIAPEINAFHFLVIPVCALSFYLTGGKRENVLFFVLNVVYFIVAYFYNLYYLPHEILVSNVISIVVIFTAFYVILAVYVWEYRFLDKIIGSKNAQLVEQNMLLGQQNLRLEEQNKLLEESNEMKNNLFSIVSQDLKGPFNNILGFSELLNEGFKTNSEQKNAYYLDLLHESVKQTSYIIEDFAYWARCQMDNVEIVREKIDARKMFEDLQQVYKSFIMAKNLSIQFDDIEPTDRKTDVTLLSIIMRNLFVNAIKYTPQNGLIVFSARSIDKRYQIRILDSGMGVSLDNLKSLERLKSPGSEGKLHPGLGLITCYELAKKINARLKFEDADGKGTAANIIFA